MPTLKLGDTVLQTYVTTLCGQRVMNTFWWEVTVAPTPLLEQDVAFDALNDQMNEATGLTNRFDACLPSNLDWYGIWFQVIGPTRLVKVTFARTGNGQFNGEAGSANVAAVITRRTQYASRVGIGSLHVPIATEPIAIEGGFVANALRTPLNALAAKMKENVSASGYTLRPKVTPNADAVGGIPWVYQTFLQDTVRIMRRRTVGLGI